jgi:hypothetical protein
MYQMFWDYMTMPIQLTASHVAYYAKTIPPCDHNSTSLKDSVHLVRRNLKHPHPAVMFCRSRACSPVIMSNFFRVEIGNSHFSLPSFNTAQAALTF